jgi:hypothetical protein
VNGDVFENNRFLTGKKDLYCTESKLTKDMVRQSQWKFNVPRDQGRASSHLGHEAARRLSSSFLLFLSEKMIDNHSLLLMDRERLTGCCGQANHHVHD